VKKRESKYRDIYWHHGVFEKSAVDFLCENAFPFITPKCHPFETHIPSDFNDVKHFRDETMKHCDFGPQDEVELRVENILSDDGEAEDQILRLEEPYYPDSFYKEQLFGLSKEKYIVMQLATISRWKSVSVLKDMHIKGPIIGAGWPEEPYRGFDGRGENWEVTAFYLRYAKGFLGIHSSCAVLSYYLDRPTIVVHFADKEGALDSMNPYMEYKPETYRMIFKSLKMEAEICKAMEEMF